MPLVVPNLAETQLLDALTGKVPQTVLTLRLYTAVSPAISNATVAAHVTEATDGGYAAKPLTAANWTTTAGTPGSSAYPKQTFTFTGPLTGSAAVLGYYLTRADGALQWIEAMGASFTPFNNGDTIDVTPVLTLGSITND